jgi:hypothetical protein
MAIEKFVEIVSDGGKLRLKLVPSGVQLEEGGFASTVPLWDLEEALQWLVHVERMGSMNVPKSLADSTQQANLNDWGKQASPGLAGSIHDHSICGCARCKDIQ